MIIIVLSTRAPACPQLSECSVTSSTWLCLSFWPTAQQQVDFLLLRRQAFMRAALRSKQMKVNTDGLLLITSFIIHTACFWQPTVCVSVRLSLCWCAGHDGGGAASPACQGPGPHGLRCKVGAPHRHHKGAWQLRRKWVVVVEEVAKCLSC